MLITTASVSAKFRSQAGIWLLGVFLAAFMLSCDMFGWSATTLGKMRPGETVVALESHYGATDQVYRDATTGGRVRRYKGKDGQWLYFFTDQQDRITAIKTTSRSFPGTSEGIKVGSTRQEMVRAYGQVGKVTSGSEGAYVCNYNVGGYRLAFIFAGFQEERLYAIQYDTRTDVFRQP